MLTHPQTISNALHHNSMSNLVKAIALFEQKAWRAGKGRISYACVNGITVIDDLMVPSQPARGA